MKLLKFLSVLTFIFLCINCSKSETPLPMPDPDVDGGEEPTEPPTPEPVVETYFTFHIDESIDTDDNQDDWIVLHDNNGDLLDYRPFESTESLVFEKRSDSITNDFSVTLIKIQFLTSDPCVGDVWHNIVTYPGIAKGSEWNYSKNPIDNIPPEKIGEFNLEIADITGNDASWILDHNFLSISNFGIYGGDGSTTSNPNGTMTLQRNGLSLYENNSPYLMSIMDEGLNLKYKIFDSPTIDESLSFNFNEFEAFDSYLYLPTLPPNTGNKIRLLGQNKDTANSHDKGFLLQELFNSNIQSPIPLGFLSQFDYYKTFFEIHFENYEYHYNRNGNKPEINIPDYPSITILNSDFASFDFQINFDYKKKVNNWIKRSDTQSCSYTWWQVHSTKDNYPIGIGLPAAIIEQYPLMLLEEAKLESSKFYINSDSYNTFIENEFAIPSEQALRDDFIEEWITLFHNE